MDSQSCVICHQPLARTSKLTLVTVSRDEAKQKGWVGRENPDGTLTVHICLQCQIQRSDSRRQATTPPL